MTRSFLRFFRRQLYIRCEWLELFISGAVASLGMSFFNKRDLPLLKTALYMRAVHCFLLMMYKEIQDSTAASYLLPAFGAILIVYCIFHEMAVIPNSIRDRVLDLCQATPGELNFVKMLDAVTTKLIE